MNTRTAPRLVTLACALALFAPVAIAAPATVVIDAAADRHPIDPRIYGVAFATEAQLKELNAPLNRWGGNVSSRYNWKLDCDNRGADWFFQSVAPSGALIEGGSADSFIARSKAGGATPMMTVPMLDWVAKVGDDRGRKLWSFSRAKYGDQQRYDQWNADSGNGLKADGKTKVTDNDPADANVPNTVDFQAAWLKHMVGKWGAAKGGGDRYYVLDNEPALWNSTHRDVHPKPATMGEVAERMLSYATMIKAADPKALIVGPEEWGWPAYFYSAADSEWRAKNGWRADAPDRAAHGGQDYVPYLLAEMKRAGAASNTRLLDVLSIHYYPQGGEYGNDVSPKTQAKRNRSTRSLWDPKYKDETWINDTVRLIPRLREWAGAYTGTLTGITEYSWGAESHMNGATAQADVLGIFGRERLDLANRWTTPGEKTPTFAAMKMYRNYDGKRSTFGETTVRATVEQPDRLSAFAAVRGTDGALTVMVVNKIGEATPAELALTHFAGGASAQLWQLTGKDAGGRTAINQLPDVAVSGGNLTLIVPGPSVTLVIIPAK